MIGSIRGDIQFLKGEKPSFGKILQLLFCRAGVQALILYRFYHLLYKKRIPLLPDLLSRLNLFLNGADIDPAAEIGPGCRIYHTSGVVIGRGVKIGKDVWISQGVTLGGSGKGVVMPGIPDGWPKIGGGVRLFSGAQILGPITVGENSIIGANSVVLESVPPNAVVVGIPGRIVRIGGERTAAEGKQGIEGELKLLRKENEELKRKLEELEKRLRSRERVKKQKRGKPWN
ncbi:MAG: serine O-acetyltransferase [Actinomycetota bacterium]|nr:serine O-acetyltransferase [Actinomycetota bacterium]